MLIKTQLLNKYISNYVKYHIQDFEIDANEIVNSTALELLSEIHKIIENDKYSDFEMVEEIVCLFEKYNIFVEGCHDF